jgi:hypothetical protein
MAEAQQVFWAWFRANEYVMFELSDANDQRFDELAERLKIVDRDMTFEIGPKRGDKRELVISAGGIKRAFQAVLDLVAAAPGFDRWSVIALRPRRVPMKVVELGGKRADPKGVQFSLVHDGLVPGIYLFIPNYIESDTEWKQIGYLLLDEALGEYDVESKLGLIRVLPPSDQSDEGARYLLSDLPRQLDELVAWLSEKS